MREGFILSITFSIIYFIFFAFCVLMLIYYQLYYIAYLRVFKNILGCFLTQLLYYQHNYRKKSRKPKLSKFFRRSLYPFLNIQNSKFHTLNLKLGRFIDRQVPEVHPGI
jgi:hypothetical protein